VPEVLGAVQRGTWCYELHAVGRGEDRYRDVPSWEPFAGPADARAAGAALARLSRCAEGFERPARAPRVLVAGWHGVTPTGLRQYLQARPLVAAALGDRLPEVEDVLGPLQERLAPLLPELASGWTHGDGHASNLLWTGDAVSAVLDLGLCDRTTPVFDLATAIERNAVSWLGEQPAADLAWSTPWSTGGTPSARCPPSTGRPAGAAAAGARRLRAVRAGVLRRGRRLAGQRRRWPWTATCSATPAGRRRPAAWRCWSTCGAGPGRSSVRPGPPGRPGAGRTRVR
jgi:hypothetical protein